MSIFASLRRAIPCPRLSLKAVGTAWSQQLVALIFGLLLCCGCTTRPPTKIPMQATYYTDRARANSTLAVMLPGINDSAQDFVRRGFVEALRSRNLPVDAVTVEAHFGYYSERIFVRHLSEDIILPARERGYDKIWLVGISLGGSGSLLYAREHAADLAGIVVLAPFLGTREVIAEVTRAGGLKAWRPGELHPEDDQRRLLTWLKDYAASPSRNSISATGKTIASRAPTHCSPPNCRGSKWSLFPAGTIGTPGASFGRGFSTTAYLPIDSHR